MTPIDKLLLAILQQSIKDYLYESDPRIIKLNREFFVSEWFKKICEHFDTNPQELRQQIFYYKVYFMKTEKLYIQDKKNKMLIVIT